MALVLADRVKETCSSPGTGAATLLGAQTGFQTFLSGVGNGNTCYYTIADQAGSRWEVGIGTYSSSGNTLTRTTPLSGSATTPVNFSSGTQDIFVTYPAEKAVTIDTLAYPPAIGSTTPNSGVFTTLRFNTSLSINGSTGSSGQVLSSTGTGAQWIGPSAFLDNITTTQGAILYRNSVGWVNLNPGTNGQVLQTNGSGSLVWAVVPPGPIIINGSSNVSIPSTNGNVSIYSAGVNTANITSSGVNVNGTSAAPTGSAINHIDLTKQTNYDKLQNLSSNTDLAIKALDQDSGFYRDLKNHL